MDKYSKFISATPLSERARERILAWNQSPNLFWEYVKSKSPEETPFEQTGYAVFWACVYSPKYQNNLSPQLQCDIGIVDLDINARRRALGSGNTGSWLEDVFVRLYDWERHKLPEEVVGEFVLQVTETAMLNGARYTREALDDFIRQMENIGSMEKEIVEHLYFGVVLEAMPASALTLQNERSTFAKIDEATKRALSSEQQANITRDVVISAIDKGDMRKAQHLAIAILKGLGKVQSAPKKLSFLRRSFAPRRIRSSASAAGKHRTEDDAGGDGDSDQGEPPGPLGAWTVDILHRLLLDGRCVR